MNGRELLLEELSRIKGTGNFHSTGGSPFFFPDLQVKGVGEIAFPLPKPQVEALISHAEEAPYGRGTRTVRDERVRKCWQIDAAEFSFQSSLWKKFLTRILATIREELGITGKISASPYKLLIYGKGGHFKPHRDTEKLEAMFGSLIVALPSAHEGGRLLIRHDGRENSVDFSAHRHDFQHAAFFADCEHEVEPVRTGYRCCVVYNLQLEHGDPSELNLSLTAQSRRLLPALAQLKSEQPGELAAVLLDHSYTEANLSLNQLKGNDLVRARALFAAAAEAGFSAHLGLVTFHQSGQLGEYSYGRRRSRYDDGGSSSEGTMGEIYEQSLTISQWRDARDRKRELGIYNVAPELLIAKEQLGAGEPDEKESEGYTGNAGCTMDHWYRRAAIVIWPHETAAAIYCRYDFAGACAMLQTRATDRNTGPDSAFQQLADTVVNFYIKSLPTLDARVNPWNHNGEPLRRLLDALATAKSGNLLERLLAKLPADAFVACDSPLWLKIHKAFGTDPFETAYQKLLGENSESSRQALFQMLASLLSDSEAGTLIRESSVHLAALGPKKTLRHWTDQRLTSPIGDSEEARVLLAASHFLERSSDRQAIVAFLRADGSLPYIREVLAPALLDKSLAKAFKNPKSLARELLTFAVGLLAAETARPLPPYPDWIRPCPMPDAAGRSSYAGGFFQRPITKRPDPIRELCDFMADPDAQIHHFARPQDERSQLEDFIRRHRLDLDCTTLRKGSPHSLVCAKNDNSHRAAIKLRAEDQALLRRLKQ